MERMYLKKWEVVLLEWVNCLKLSDPIQDLEDLKDGNFFTNLLKLIIPIDPDNPTPIFARIYEFLGKEYPNVSLNYDNHLNVEELDLIIISSLLLHYSCIHDRRDVLTSPLCYQLSKQTQTTIKVYLEKTTKHVKRDNFFDIVEASFNYQKKKSRNNLTLSCSYSNSSSPLQAFLHTPVSKAPRYREKDREINKLRSELDLERFEKIDLQKELVAQKERNKNLSQQIHNKTMEITKLHNEMSDLEGKLAPNNCSNEWSELQQKLRREINSLEQYISQLHGEQEKIFEEKDEIKEKMKTLQGECKFWQEKAISIESNYENISEKYKEQEFELDNLRRHCAELSSLLQELQSTKRADDSCDEVDVADNYRKKFENASSSEDLACVVVEVQLRDVQKENVELKKSLKDCQENIARLDSEVYKFKIKIKQLEGDLEILEGENQDLHSKVTVLIKTREMLNKTKTDLEQTAFKLQDVLNHNECLTTNVIIKDKQLLESKNTVESLHNSNGALSGKLQTLNQDNQILQSNLRESREQLIRTQSEYENTSKCLAELKTDIEEVLEKFEKFLFGASKLDLKDFQSAFMTVLTELENDRVRQLKEKQSITEDTLRLEKLVAMQKTQLVALNEREENHLTDIEKLTRTLKNAKEEISVLEETVSSYLDKIKSLKSAESEMKIIQAELNMNKVVLEEKIQILENQVEECNNKEELIKKIILELRTDLKDQSLTFDSCLEILQLETKNLTQKVNTLTSNLDEARSAIEQCKINEEQLLKDVNEYTDKFQVMERQHEHVKKELRIASTTKKKLKKDSDMSKTNYEKEITSLKDSLKSFEEQLEIVTNSEYKLRQQVQESGFKEIVSKGLAAAYKNDISEKNKKIESIQNHIKSLKNQNEILRKKNRDLDKEYLSIQQTTKKLEKKSDNLENNIQSIVKELFLKNEELNAIVIKNKEYQEKSETKIASLEEDLFKTNAELSLAMNLNETSVNDYEKKVSNLNAEIELLINKENRSTLEFNEVKDELNVTVSKYTEVLQAHQELQVENESQINNLTENLHELIKKYNTLDNTHQETIKQLNSVENTLGKCTENEIKLEEDVRNQQRKFEDELNKNTTNFNLKINDLQKKEAELVDSLTKTKEKLHVSKKNNEEMYDNFQRLCVVVAHEKVDAQKLLKRVNTIQSSCKKLKDSFEELKCEVQSFPKKNSQCLSTFNCQLSLGLNALLEDNDRLKKSNGNLQHMLSALQDDCGNFKKDLEKLKEKESEITLFKEENKSQKEALNVLIKDKEELQYEISAEKSKLIELTENIKMNIEGYEFKLNEFKENNNVLTIDKCNLEEIIKEISSLEEAKTTEILRLEGLIITKDDEIKTLIGTLDVKKSEVEEARTKNNNLKLELVSLKESFDLLVQKFDDLEQVLEREREASTKYNEELLVSKKEIEILKEKVKTVYVERQALELEIKVANEKIIEYESFVRKKETDIGNANTKLVTKLEEILHLEKSKQTLQVQVDELSGELTRAINEKEEIKQSFERLCEDAASERVKLEEAAAEQQNSLLKRIEVFQHEMDSFDETRALLDKDKEIRLSNLTEENLKLAKLLWSLKNTVQNLIHTLSENPFEIEENKETGELSTVELESINASMEMLQEKILRVKEQNKLNIQQIAVVEAEKLEISQKLQEAVEQMVTIENGREKLLQDFHAVQDEQIKLEKDLQDYRNLQVAHEVCRAKYEQLQEYQKNVESSRTVDLEDNLDKLKKKVFAIQDTCGKCAGHSTSFKTAIDKLVNERNFLENLVSNLRYNLLCLQTKVLDVKDEREGSKLKEQVEAFEFISEDLQKQFVQISKKVHTTILNIIEIPTKTYDIIVAEKFTEATGLFESVNFEEELEKITDCRDSANNLLQQIGGLEATLGSKLTKMNKENVLKSSSNVLSDGKVKDEDLKKKNTVLKQRLTLSDNAKSNLEKKIKQLRQENKFLQEKTDNNMEVGYKTLLQQHIELKDKLNKSQEQRVKLSQEIENYKAKLKLLPDQNKHEKIGKSDQKDKLEKEVAKLRDAYSNVMSDNSRLNLETSAIKKLLEDRTQQLAQLSLIKEAYEKLLEENNTFRMELDTIKYKRNKDREALLEATKKTQDLKIEYEVKLEKMKEKTVQLYREEMNRENLKYHNEKLLMMNKLVHQQSLLDKKRAANAKFKEYSSCDNESYSSGDSFFITSDASHLHSTRIGYRSTENLASNRKKRVDSCKCATLPKTSGTHLSAESQNHKRNTLQRSKAIIEMEDEDDELFNNKYLADLKDGRCTLSSDRESNTNRLSELKWRNSLYPPHLKSSYPAETQFNSPTLFKEEDIKSGALDFNDSMSIKLIAGEKPRKKDIGTTSYKKPGPPTPSKNGGRMSLQGNEREVLREHNDPPKRNTPSRLKNLFLGRNMSTKDNSENQPATPRSKRLSIFRKQK